MQIIINPPENPIFMSIFGLDLRYYGIILSFAIFVGISLCYYLFTKKSGKNEADFFIDYVPLLIVFALIGARFFYVIGNLSFYLNHKKEIFLINHGGISVWGAIIFGITGLFFYLKHKNKNFMLHFDIISVVMPLCQAIGRFGNYFNQEAFGLPCDSFIKLYVAQAFRPEKYVNYKYFHPTFLYESLLDFAIFLLLFCFMKYKKDLKQGTIFCFYIICYSTVRIIIESIRTDSIAYAFNIPVASIISIIMLIFSIFALKKIYK